MENNNITSEQAKKLLKEQLAAVSLLHKQEESFFDAGTLTKILVSSLPQVPVPEEFNSAVLNKVGIGEPLSGVQRIIEYLGTKTIAAALAAIVVGGVTTLFLISDKPLQAPVSKTLNTQETKESIESTAKTLRHNTEFNSLNNKATTEKKNTYSRKSNENIKVSEPAAVTAIPGKKTTKNVTEHEED